MSSISKCPRCEQSVTIPDGVAAEARVRCPLCAAEYPLSNALAGVPPTLIVIEPAAAAAMAPDAVALGAMAEVPSMQSLMEPAVAEGPVEPAAEAVPPAETGGEAGAAVEAGPDDAATTATSETAEGATVDGPVAEIEHELDLVSDAEAAAKEGEEAVAKEGEEVSVKEGEEAAETVRETFDSASFAGIGEAPIGEGQQPPPGVPRWRTRRRAKEKNPVKEVIGIALGGFLGLLIGYYVLAWCGLGKSLPQFNLPFLPSKEPAKTDGDNKTGAEPDNSESRAPAECGPYDRSAA